MATTKIWDVKGWLGKLVIYAENPDKTENPAYYEKSDMSDHERQGLADVIEYAANGSKTELHRYVSGVNCLPETARQEMMIVKRQYGKENGIVAFHGLQSFAPGETTPEAAHEIGVKLAEQLWGGNFQVIVATHTDKSHIHNHFVLNSVGLDGHRYNDCKATYREMRRASDALCREYGLSMIKEPKSGQSKHYGEWKAEQEGRPTWRGLVKADVDRAIAESVTDWQFFYNLRAMGYEIKTGKDISVRPPGKERFVRLARNFGEDYTYEAICKRILEGGQRPKPSVPKQLPSVRAVRLRGQLHNFPMGKLRRRYLYYCYRLGVLPRHRKMPPARLHFLHREDLRNLRTITRETGLLLRVGIDTAEQLAAHTDSLTVQLGQLCDERKNLRNRARVLPDGEQKEAIRSQASALTKRIGAVRKDIRLCEGIAARSAELEAKQVTVQQESKQRREEKQHEHGRRRGGSGREIRV